MDNTRRLALDHHSNVDAVADGYDWDEEMDDHHHLHVVD